MIVRVQLHLQQFGDIIVVFHYQYFRHLILTSQIGLNSAAASPLLAWSASWSLRLLVNHFISPVGAKYFAHIISGFAKWNVFYKNIPVALAFGVKQINPVFDCVGAAVIASHSEHGVPIKAPEGVGQVRRAHFYIIFWDKNFILARY